MLKMKMDRKTVVFLILTLMEFSFLVAMHRIYSVVNVWKTV